MRLLLSRAHYPVTVLGPGRRAGVWTQGCTIRCSGCLSRDTWEADPATAVPVDEILRWLRTLPGPVDGVTISGGEPFQQPEALRELLHGIREWRGEGEIDILVYSGYPLSRLRRNTVSRELLSLCDAAITGPYVARLGSDTLRWRGSANQRIVPISDLGRVRYENAETSPGFSRMQVTVESDRIYYIGIPRRDDMNRVSERLERAGIRSEEVSWRP